MILFISIPILLIRREAWKPFPYNYFVAKDDLSTYIIYTSFASHGLSQLHKHLQLLSYWSNWLSNAVTRHGRRWWWNFADDVTGDHII